MDVQKISPTMRMYYRRKENGLCVQCGKTLDCEGVKCKKCKEEDNAKRRKLVHWYQDNGICPECRKNSIIGDEKVCLECSTKRYSQRIARYNINPEEFKTKDCKTQKKRYESLKEKGICTYCGKRKATTGFYTCEYCRAKVKERKRKKRAQEERFSIRKYWIENGFCAFCGKEAKPGYKLCEQHYNSAKLNGAKAAKARKERGTAY